MSEKLESQREEPEDLWDVEETIEIPKTVIKLPEDQELVEKLRNKLTEYDKRRGGRDTGKWKNDHSMYKWIILNRLIEAGEVKLDELAEEISKTHGGINMREFKDAAQVIEIYSKGLSVPNIFGGTGLK